MQKKVIGIDIGGTSTKFGVVSDGKIISRGEIPTCLNDDPQDFVNRLRNCFPNISGVQSLGVGAPNGNFYRGTIEHAPNLQWKGIVPMAAMLEKSFGLPCALTNDANAAAQGEMTYGGAKGMKNFIYITLGTGLGSGIVVNGEVVLGHSGFAGEVGQVIAVPNGRLCGCGRRGCLETYVSANGLVKTVEELLQTDNGKSVLNKNAVNELTAEKVSIAAEQNDELALKAFKITSEMLGIALANAVSFTSPEAIFLFGGLARSGHLLFDPTIKEFNRNLHIVYQGSVIILPSSLPSGDAAILGAASLAG